MATRCAISPSRARTTSKFASDRTIDTVTDYVLVSQKKARVEHFHRHPDGTWSFRVLGPGESLALTDLGCEIAVDRIYWKVFSAPLG